LIAFLFFFSIATGGRRRGRHDDGRVRAAIWTPSDARYLFLIALPLQVNGRYNHLKIVNITEERGGGKHTHVWVITVPSERINSGDPRQFTNAGRGEASIAIHTHTHTHTHVVYTHAIVIRYTGKNEEEEEENFLTASSVMDRARQKQRALVLVFLSNFPVIHLPLNTKW
jgi:hypothetical protein